MAMTAQSLYGWVPDAQPTATGTPDHAGAPEPTVATTRTDDRHRPAAYALVAVIGLAILLTQVSFRGTIAVRA